MFPGWKSRDLNATSRPQLEIACEITAMNLTYLVPNVWVGKVSVDGGRAAIILSTTDLENC